MYGKVNGGQRPESDCYGVVFDNGLSLFPCSAELCAAWAVAIDRRASSTAMACLFARRYGYITACTALPARSGRKQDEELCTLREGIIGTAVFCAPAVCRRQLCFELIEQQIRAALFIELRYRASITMYTDTHDVAAVQC